MKMTIQIRATIHDHANDSQRTRVIRADQAMMDHANKMMGGGKTQAQQAGWVASRIIVGDQWCGIDVIDAQVI